MKMFIKGNTYLTMITELPNSGYFKAFAMIVDINGFTRMFKEPQNSDLP